MKKFVAILMAAMLVLASVSAFAAGKSVIPTDNTTTGSTVFIIVDPETVAEEYRAKLSEAEDQLTVFTDAVQASVKEKVGDAAFAYEQVSLRAPGWDQKSEEYLVLEFATQYLAGAKVCAVLVTVTGEEIEENVLTATVPEDYKVNVYWPVPMMQKIWDSDEAFIVIMSEEIVESVEAE